MTTATAPAPAPAAPAPAPAAPAPSPAPAPAPAPAAPAPAPAPTDSLLRAPAAPAPAPAPNAPAPAPETFEFAEKVRVFAADGKLDEVATGKKAEAARRALEKKLGVGDIRPETAEAYAWNRPDSAKDLDISQLESAFRVEAHAKGFTGEQYQFMMDKFAGIVPDLMGAGAKMSRSQAEVELKKTWPSSTDYAANLAAAQTATSKLPADVQEALHELGTQPAVVRALAHLGAKMREDTPPEDTGGGIPNGFDPNDPAVLAIAKDSRHPKNAQVVAQRKAYFDAQAKRQPQ